MFLLFSNLTGERQTEREREREEDRKNDRGKEKEREKGREKDRDRKRKKKKERERENGQEKRIIWAFVTGRKSALVFHGVNLLVFLTLFQLVYKIHIHTYVFFV